MERLETVGGVPSASNAFAVDRGGKLAYLHDPCVDAVVRVDLRTGERRLLKWSDLSFHHRRWVIYSLFVFQKSDEDVLSVLFFNSTKKSFYLIHFNVTPQLLLVKVQTSALNVDSFIHRRFAYSAHQQPNSIQLIFYERRRPSVDGSEDEESEGPAFIFCECSTRSLRVSTKKGRLPARGIWELPFVTHQSLHFIDTTSTPTQLAATSLTATMDSTDEVIDWNVRPVFSLHPAHLFPPRKAIWCNAWTAPSGMGWFAVAEKSDGHENEETSCRNISLWKLNITAAHWTRHPMTISAPVGATNFALRLILPPASASSSIVNSAILHADYSKREAAFIRAQLDYVAPSTSVASPNSPLAPLARMSSSSSTSQDESDEKAIDEVVCAVCLEIYEDARQLPCGHSYCWKCIEQIRLNVQGETIRCPECRQQTQVPKTGGGFAVNFALNAAVRELKRGRLIARHGVACANCRRKFSDSQLWTCMRCLRTADVKARGMEQPESNDVLHADMTEHTFCADCVLRSHAGHPIEEFVQYREKEQKTRLVETQALQLLDDTLVSMEQRLGDILKSRLLEPARRRAVGSVCSLLDTTVPARTNRPIERVTQELQDFSERLTNGLLEAVESLLTDNARCVAFDPFPRSASFQQSSQENEEEDDEVTATTTL